MRIGVRRLRVAIAVVLATVLPHGQILAQGFTAAAEVRPILEATRANWVAVREYDGADLVYFTQLLAWRCGLSEIRYGLNGAEPETVFPMEPCYDGTAQPNAIKSDAIYLREALGSVSSISVRLIFDDGSTADARFERAQVLMP